MMNRNKTKVTIIILSYVQLYMNDQFIFDPKEIFEITATSP